MSNEPTSELPPVDLAAAAQMWADYRNSCATDPGDYVVEYFGDSAELAEALLHQVTHGQKRATSSLENEYLAENEPLPRVGSHWIACDGSGTPKIILRTSEVTLKSFDQVDADFAFAEGEDDRSLASWRREHEKFWKRTQQADFAKQWEPAMTGVPGERIVCERFEVVWPRS
ncbi:ASCH domain-containing protein [Arthrobacter sp. MYb224]|uniref:ASCH domain-containing protein n=1 Tax=Micrococcaceae TaxID=1268 RepID=UPI000BB8638E|nr:MULTISPECIES: ASCH domain-containing protein [Micrococcaceae]PCC28906.1 hypothetical protein CIK76_09325 [Glutamicibacter sp. BW80]PQZ98795.1 ASCH domain-containing protein [Arthrobacter sp. MYb224]PRA03131.1 ASCH domain-containing protein [Arthrobacter sp. MYb229]PRB49602.1 ASCH domain-containing protein [Arthrobacter sp. MYb216]